MDKIVKIIVVDDHELFRKGVVMVIKKMDNMQVIAEASNGKEFLRLLNSHIPDIVFMDIKMPEVNGVDATIEAIARYPQMKVIALSMFGEEEYLQKMIKAGAVGYMLKPVTQDKLATAIGEVYEEYANDEDDELDILDD